MRRTKLISDGWRFSPLTADRRFGNAYHLTKTGAARGMASVSYDDHAWARVTVPHDGAINGELDLELSDFGGFLPRPDVCYRRHFQLEKAWRNGRVQLYFEGITGKSDIYVNGVLAARSESSYNGVRVDVTDMVRFGGAGNVVSILSDNSLPEGWWYEGAGIYRNVYLIACGRVGIEDDTVRIVSQPGSDGAWRMDVEAQLYNALGGAVDAVLRAELMDGDACLAQGQTSLRLEKRERRTGSLSLAILHPELWDIGHGRLYTVRLSAWADGDILDCFEAEHGFRTIAFDADRGFFINGRSEKLKGLCYHEDEGNLGVALDAGTFRRRLENLLAMGGNAYRCAHNAPNPILLSLCDRMGILVMDETRMFASTPIACRELEAMIRRDRNHPSVVIWSLGNEEPWQADERGARITETMRALAHRVDGTRPVTMAMHSGYLNVRSAAESCDVVGLNYHIEDYEALKVRYPDHPMVATEVFCLADENEENGLYGAEEAVKTLRYTRRLSFLSGTFGWAGQDYRGEHRYLSFFTDACPMASNGERKDGFYRYAAAWREETVIHICGHWNHAEGQNVSVTVFSNAEEVELVLNGRSLGRREPGDAWKVVFETPYQPGELVARGFVAGVLAAEDRISTADAPVRIRLTAEPVRPGERLAVVAECVDAAGRRHPMGSHWVKFSAKNGRILCADNADPYFHRGSSDDETMFYHGRARAMVELPARGGEVTVTADSPTLAGAALSVTVEPDPRPKVPDSENPCINDWFVSRVWHEKPDIRSYTPDNQYIRGQKYFEPWRMKASDNPFYFRSGYVVYCTEPDIPAVTPGKVPAVVFEEIAAGAEVLISIRDYNNVVRHQFYRQTKRCGPLTIPLEGARGGERLIIKVLLDSSMQRDDLLAKPIRFEV